MWDIKLKFDNFKNDKKFNFSTHQFYPAGHEDDWLDGDDHDDVDGQDRQGQHCSKRWRQRQGGLEKEQEEEDEDWRMCGKVKWDDKGCGRGCESNQEGHEVNVGDRPIGNQEGDEDQDDEDSQGDEDVDGNHNMVYILKNSNNQVLWSMVRVNTWLGALGSR